ncbi:hypothetical protein MHB84_10300 [Paenibacillus sp. FSL F4-0087]
MPWNNGMQGSITVSRQIESCCGWYQEYELVTFRGIGPHIHFV